MTQPEHSIFSGALEELMEKRNMRDNREDLLVAFDVFYGRRNPARQIQPKRDLEYVLQEFRRLNGNRHVVSGDRDEKAVKKAMEEALPVVKEHLPKASDFDYLCDLRRNVKSSYYPPHETEYQIELRMLELFPSVCLEDKSVEWFLDLLRIIDRSTRDPRLAAEPIDPVIGSAETKLAWLVRKELDERFIQYEDDIPTLLNYWYDSGLDWLLVRRMQEVLPMYFQLVNGDLLQLIELLFEFRHRDSLKEMVEIEIVIRKENLQAIRDPCLLAGWAEELSGRRDRHHHYECKGMAREAVCERIKQIIVASEPEMLLHLDGYFFDWDVVSVFYLFRETFAKRVQEISDPERLDGLLRNPPNWAVEIISKRIVEILRQRGWKHDDYPDGGVLFSFTYSRIKHRLSHFSTNRLIILARSNIKVYKFGNEKHTNDLNGWNTGLNIALREELLGRVEKIPENCLPPEWFIGLLRKRESIPKFLRGPFEKKAEILCQKLFLETQK